VTALILQLIAVTTGVGALTILLGRRVFDIGRMADTESVAPPMCSPMSTPDTYEDGSRVIVNQAVRERAHLEDVPRRRK
jgi:hypothetical protein